MLPLFFALSTLAIADYSAPPPDKMMKTATGVIDATITGFDAEGDAILEVHQVLAGQSTDEITNVYLTCFGGSPKNYGMKAGQRYVVLLFQGDQLYEETSYFEVRGDLEVKFWTGDEHWERHWTDMNTVRETVQANRA